MGWSGGEPDGGPGTSPLPLISAGEGPPAPPSPRLPLQGEAVPELESALPKGLPSLSRASPFPTHLLV